MSQTIIRSSLMPKSRGKLKSKMSVSLANDEGVAKPDIIEMRSETLPSRTVNADDREGRINYTLDMVVHDLISQGNI